MWTTRTEQQDGGRVLKVGIDLGGSPVAFSDVLRLWRSDADFRSFFNASLAGAPFFAFRWETPPIHAGSAGRPFEFALLNSPEWGGRPDAEAFAEHFGPAGSGQDVVTFPNLGRDAILVVPCPIAPPSAYGHLASFVREAPDSQRHALWALVGEAMERRLGGSTVWLSTAGAGVPWLHVRLDDRPKYYGFGPYRVPPS